MATQTVDSEPQSPSVEKLVSRVVDEPTGGAGVFYAAYPLGIALQLGALGVVLALLSAANAELFNQAATGFIVPVALGVGAIAITAGGLINFRAGSLIAGVIGVLYGTFWLSVGLLLLLSAGGLTEAVGPAGFGDAFGTYLFIWGVVSGFLALGTLYVNKIVFAQQALLTVVFFVLAFGQMSAPGGSGLINLGGWLGLVDAGIAMYISAALIVNDTAGKDVLPFG